MKTWVLQCVHRKTGKESVESFPATDEDEARSFASDRGLLVGKVLRIEEPRHHPESVTTSTPTFAERPGQLAAGGAILSGVLLLLAGAGVTLFGLVMDTTTYELSMRDANYHSTGVHNVGLLNRQLCIVIVGVGMFVAGAVILGMVRVCGEVFEWGNRILRRLERDSLREQLKDE